MPKTIILSESDPRVGTYNADGSFASWPAVNLDGGRYVRENAIVQQIGSHFVVLPPIQPEEVEVKIGDPSGPTVELSAPDQLRAESTGFSPAMTLPDLPDLGAPPSDSLTFDSDRPRKGKGA